MRWRDVWEGLAFALCLTVITALWWVLGAVWQFPLQ